MAVFFIQHRVADFDTWHQGYVAAADIQKAGGVTEKAVYRMSDDPNLVLVMHRFDSIDSGEAFLANPDLIAAQQAAGVDRSTLRVEAYEET